MFLLRLEGNNVKKENVTQKMFLLYVLNAPCAASIPAAHRNPKNKIGHVRGREERGCDELRRHRAAAPLRLRNTVKSVVSQTTFAKRARTAAVRSAERGAAARTTAREKNQ
ncbi:hypothetical protein VNO80_19700 [Phaseolus coccineus]|uniref:Uncharacterized protein n=1 Tax=Phaseolus coccineus TaxID=3886 RepID=A0AAN9MGN6_PHACN